MMAGRLLPPLAAAALLAALASGRATAEPLVADLSSHLITITSSYTGTNLLLFGAIERGGDVIVVTRGPAQQVVVRRKKRVAGIWVNSDAVTFSGVPGYYAVAATRPLEEFTSEALLARLGVGHENLRLDATGELSGAALQPYREALARNMARAGLYPSGLGTVTWLGSSLFRTQISFPTNVPTGNYAADVYLIRDDEVVSAQNTPLFIRKTGIERAIYEWAHGEPLLYGLAAVLLAVAAGWIAAVVFRRV